MLRVKVVDDTPRPATRWTPAACDAMGYGRTIAIPARSAVPGLRVEDLAGYAHFVRPPDGLATIDIQDGWTLVARVVVEESETGRWQRSMDEGRRGRPGHEQGQDRPPAFDGPANVTGGDDIRNVQVNGTPAKCLSQHGQRSRVLVWTLGKDGLTLVVNETEKHTARRSGSPRRCALRRRFAYPSAIPEPLQEHQSDGGRPRKFSDSPPARQQHPAGSRTSRRSRARPRGQAQPAVTERTEARCSSPKPGPDVEL